MKTSALLITSMLSQVSALSHVVEVQEKVPVYLVEEVPFGGGGGGSIQCPPGFPDGYGMPYAGVYCLYGKNLYSCSHPSGVPKLHTPCANGCVHGDAPTTPDRCLPEPENACFHSSTEFSPLDMWGTTRSVERSVEACQHRCKTVPGCARFSFWPTDGGCHLQDVTAVRVPSAQAMSGPAYCGNNHNVDNNPAPQCAQNTWCGSCMRTPGCLWDDNWKKCKTQEQCDYLKPREVAYSLQPIDEQPQTNTVCFSSLNQCYNPTTSPVIVANPNADRCSKAQGCNACVGFYGCVFDHHNGKCVTYDNTMQSQCENPWFHDTFSRYTCQTNNCWMKEY